MTRHPWTKRGRNNPRVLAYCRGVHRLLDEILSPTPPESTDRAPRQNDGRIPAATTDTPASPATRRVSRRLWDGCDRRRGRGARRQTWTRGDSTRRCRPCTRFPVTRRWRNAWAGGHTVTASGVGRPAELSAGVTQCAVEGGTCAFTGTRGVAFGADNYRHRTATASSTCAAATWGGSDRRGPEILYVAPIGGLSTYTPCAPENGTSTVSAPTRAAYGANGAFTYRDVATGSVACTNAACGSDPLPGIAKACYRPPGGWTAGRSGRSVRRKRGMRVGGRAAGRLLSGARGAFYYTPSTGNMSRTNAAWAVSRSSGEGAGLCTAPSRRAARARQRPSQSTRSTARCSPVIRRPSWQNANGPVPVASRSAVVPMVR